MLTSNDLSQIDKLIKKRVEASERKITNKINIVITLFDNDFKTLRQRVERIEEHLNLN